MSIDQQFVEYIVKSLVGSPDAVVVERRIDEKGVLLELTVDPEDLGRVIGKRGATAQSLRTLLRALGTKNEARYNLKIIDNGTGGGGRDEHSTSDYHHDDQQQGISENQTSNRHDDVGRQAAPELQSVSAHDQSSDRMSQTRKELADLDDLDL